MPAPRTQVVWHHVKSSVGGCGRAGRACLRHPFGRSSTWARQDDAGRKPRDSQDLMAIWIVISQQPYTGCCKFLLVWMQDGPISPDGSHMPMLGPRTREVASWISVKSKGEGIWSFFFVALKPGLQSIGYRYSVPCGDGQDCGKRTTVPLPIEELPATRAVSRLQPVAGRKMQWCDARDDRVACTPRS